MSRQKRTRIIEIAAYVFSELGDLGARIESAAATTNSIYMCFDDTKFGKLRISDHGCRSDVSYKWNIIIDGKNEIRENLNYANYKRYKQFVAYMRNELLFRQRLKLFVGGLDGSS